LNDEWIGLIPAAGKGIRLGLPYPKELYPVIRNNRYKPVAQFVLDSLVEAGVDHNVFVINEAKNQLIGFFGNGNRFGCNISYVVQEQISNSSSSTSPGLAHAINTPYHLTKGKIVFFGMADTIIQPKEVFRIGYQSMQKEDDVLLCLFETNKPEKFGMVRMVEGRKVSEIIDKPVKTDLTQMWGCMIWRPVFTDFIFQSIQDGVNDFALILNQAIKQGMNLATAVIPDSNFIDLGTYEEIMELDRHFREE
jgi:glucose-1-phosphate thymidylyltransferase